RHVLAMIGGDALQAADRHRLLLDAPAAAGRLARPVADAPEDPGKHVRFAVHHVGVGEPALRDQSDVFRNIGVGRAGPLTIHDSMVVIRMGGIGGFHSLLGHGALAFMGDEGTVSIEMRRGFSSPMKAKDRKSTRLNSSHVEISYAVFCLKKKKKKK